MNEELNFCENSKKYLFFFWGGRVGGGREVRVCERKIEFFVKIQKK